MADHNLLDDVFKAPQKDVETFADIVMAGQSKFAPKEILQIKKTANFKEEKQKTVTITHGEHDKNYVWHIRPTHQKQAWAVNIERVIFAIGKVLNETVPRDILIDIFPPNAGWDLEEITIKANDALDHWSVTQADFDKTTGQLFEVLGTLIKGPR